MVNTLCNTLNVGNIYVNRNQIGAVVGSQPFGGEGLSGTGPKAGGAEYLTRFVAPQPPKDGPYAEATLSLEDVQAYLSALPKLGRTQLSSTILPGPTGELNQISLYARGTILCLGPSLIQAREQAKLAQNAGCRTVIIAKGIQKTEGISGVMALEDLEYLHGFDAVALWANDTDLRKARSALANRNGALIPLIDAKDVTARCTIERHVCIDTTAAGGNAALLAAGT